LLGPAGQVNALPAHAVAGTYPQYPVMAYGFDGKPLLRNVRQAMSQLRGAVVCDEGYGKGHGQRRKGRQTRIISGLCAAF